jgi:predicted  nucleic acid-binding Zn-ribbon protein
MSNAVAIDPTLASDERANLLEKYRSRPKQLARWLLESRDTLRKKYQGLKVELNRLKVRVSDVTKSRDNWRQQAEDSDQQVRAMKAEVERLAALLEQAGDSGSQKK